MQSTIHKASRRGGGAEGAGRARSTPPTTLSPRPASSSRLCAIAPRAAMTMTTTRMTTAMTTNNRQKNLVVVVPQARAQLFSQTTATTAQQQRRCRRPRLLTPNNARAHKSVRVAAVFTGIVQGKARVAAVESRPGFTHMTLEFPPGAADTARMGASVAVNGTCLTVVEETLQAGKDRLAFDLIAETLRATTLGDLKVGDEVNFERAARVGDEIGGHSVSGHVHTTAEVVAVEEAPDNRRLVFRVEREAGRWMRYVLPKGFVAVDGCSLTVGEVDGDTFAVYLIPETLRVTTLGERRAAAGGDSAARGGRCNIEVEAQTQAVVDTVERVLGDYVSKAVQGGQGPLAEAVRAVVGAGGGGGGGGGGKT